MMTGSHTEEQKEGVNLAERYFTPEEVSDLLKVKVETVWSWCRTGRLKAIKLSKVYRIPEEALSAFIEGGDKSE